jgi:hypothetical protein
LQLQLALTLLVFVRASTHEESHRKNPMARTISDLGETVIAGATILSLSLNSSRNRNTQSFGPEPLCQCDLLHCLGTFRVDKSMVLTFPRNPRPASGFRRNCGFVFNQNGLPPGNLLPRR